MGAPAPAIPTAQLAAGERIPVLGQAPRGRPADSAHRRAQIAALRAGIDAGLTLIAAAEETDDMVAEAIVRRHDDVFLIARVAGREATRDGIAAACTASLRRLETERIDLYLVHGRSAIPLEETVEGLELLREAGLILHWGVADFTLVDLAELFIHTRACAADEVVYDLAHRAVEWDLLDGCRDRGVKPLAWCGLELPPHRRLHEVAARHGLTPAQVELAWLLSHEELVVLAPCETPQRVEQYRAALELRLDGHDLALLDDAYPPPLGPQPLTKR